MKILGFNYTKLCAEKRTKVEKPTLRTNIRFTNLEKEKSELKENEIVKMSFIYELLYTTAESETEKQGEIICEGFLFVTFSKEESKDLWKLWKKKEVSSAVKLPLFNYILRKCTTKAVLLQEEVGLPSHIPIPRLAPQSEKAN